MRKWLVTGGAGFIGSNFILAQRAEQSAYIINLDKLTYAGNLKNLESLHDDPQYIFIHGDICNRKLVRDNLNKYQPHAVIHFAAETHVDRSIPEPDTFIKTNVLGTFSLLEEVFHYWKNLGSPLKDTFRFLHISTDEIYGSLGPGDHPSSEQSPYRPNSPYAASKASSNHLVRAYQNTYGLPTLITNCSNNYGPYQFPEKLIPLIILNALEGKALPIYGDGENIRDWLYVEDTNNALKLVIERGKVGETYNIGGCCEKTNIEVVKLICTMLDQLYPNSPHIPHESLIKFVKDRPGHDRRYAMDISKIEKEMGWKPKKTLDAGLKKTIQWYIDNPEWIKSIKTDTYRKWIEKNYKKR